MTAPARWCARCLAATPRTARGRCRPCEAARQAAIRARERAFAEADRAIREAASAVVRSARGRTGAVDAVVSAVALRELAALLAASGRAASRAAEARTVARDPRGEPSPALPPSLLVAACCDRFTLPGVAARLGVAPIVVRGWLRGHTAPDERRTEALRRLLDGIGEAA